MSFGPQEWELAPERVAELLATGAVELVDVREPYEFEAGHVEGARHVPLERLSEEAASIPHDRPLVFQCRVGARSAMAAQAFRAAGFDAYNLSGGLVEWAAHGLPLSPEGGTVADH